MTKQRLIIDMDDVLADTGTAMIEIYNQKYGKSLTANDFKGRAFFDVIDKEHFAATHQHFYEVGFFRNLSVLANAKEVMQELWNVYDVYIVSAATEYPNSLSEKIAWLGEHFPYISWKKIVFCGDKRIVSGDIMIDDHIKNLSVFKGRTIMMDALHNQTIHTYERATDWLHIKHLLL